MDQQIGQPAYDEAKLWGWMKKAQRVLLEPLADEFKHDPCVRHKVLKSRVQSIVDLHPPSETSSIWGIGLGALHARLSEIYHVSDHVNLEVVKSSFPHHQDEYWRHDPRYCATGLLNDVVHNFLLGLVSKGKVICLAEHAGEFFPVKHSELFCEYESSCRPAGEFTIGRLPKWIVKTYVQRGLIGCGLRSLETLQKFLRHIIRTGG